MTSFGKVVLFGAGNMGGAMLARLRDLGWSVAVNDTDARAHAQAVALGAVPAAQAQQRLEDGGAGREDPSDILVERLASHLPGLDSAHYAAEARRYAEQKEQARNKAEVL